MILQTLNLKIPLSFFNSNLEPLFGIVVIFASFMISGMMPSCFMLFNIVNKLNFKFAPITFSLKSSAQSPLGSLALPVLGSLIVFFKLRHVKSWTFISPCFSKLQICCSMHTGHMLQ